MNDRAVFIVQEYISELYIKELPPCQKRAFMQQSYSRWAAEEILRCIQERGSKQPVTVIEEFANKMDKYSLANSNTSYIFSVGYDTAMDILDRFLLYEKEVRKNGI